MSNEQPPVVAAEPPPLERFEASGPAHPSPPIRAGFAPPPPRATSPRSRAPSATSSIDSSRASSSFSATRGQSHSSAPDTRLPPDLPAAQLKPAQHGDGFLVDVPGTGQWLVSWAELVDLLMSPRTHETLSPNGLIGEMIRFVHDRLEKANALPESSRPSTAVNNLGANLNGLSFGGGGESSSGAHSFHAPVTSSGYAPAPVSSYYGEDATAHPESSRHATVAPLQTVAPYFLAPINTELPLPPTSYAGGAQPTPTNSSTALAQHPSVHGRQAFAYRSGSPAPSLSGRSDSAASSRLHHRQTSAPYPRPSYLHSSSSYTDYSSAGGESFYTDCGGPDDCNMYDEQEPGTALPSEVTGYRATLPKVKGPRPPSRALNGETETYIWNERKGSLSRVPPGVDAHELASYSVGGSEVLVFPPGTYHKVVVDGLEVLPCDSRQRVNAFLRGQLCVEGCGFRFEGKRPSVIRAHVVHCKSRASTLRVDPLKRFCQLQLDAHTLDTRMRNTHKVPIPDPRKPHGFERGDDQSDSRSILSFESVDSHGGYSASSSQGSIYEQGGQHGHGSKGQEWEPQYASTKRDEFNESSAASVLSAGFTPSSSQALEGQHQQRPQEQWLESYGLSVPTGGSASAASSRTPSEQRQPVSARSSAVRTAAPAPPNKPRPSSFLEL
ncbi:uncharacterized protein RHOBADRAFT_54108 [Rhodotorula graminis WP1]|uniref:Uncharacterized protein n=1 Tax=Rhodotorula graminis (strain WP1) TaxID=578459 RepID=A0A194S157_RHOGW|nr:uncharacterized protein RHOBADRAFT_54108 [Rhodotorula graminis WP1]KPV74264.1 hypothetical protein RHOBADRAFT_54108 [Rhodotorula graminis WP1]